MSDLTPETLSEYEDGAAAGKSFGASAVRQILRALAAEKARAEQAEDTHRDLVSRLGFGDNITEPMADNDTIVKWFEEQSRDANEWQESQLWRNDCYVAGHPDDEDCPEHDPTLRLHNAERALSDFRDAVKALAPKCYTFDGPTTCLTVIGAKFPNGTEFTEEAACLPCRLRRLAETDADNGGGEGQ